MPPSSSLTGLQNAAFGQAPVAPNTVGMQNAAFGGVNPSSQPYDPTTDTGYMHIGSDLPNFPDTWMSPHDPHYVSTLQAAAAQRYAGTPNAQGGPGGQAAQGMQTVNEGMKALAATTGKQVQLGKKALPGLPTDPMPGAGVMGTS